MRRREFIAGLGSAAATWPIAARAQQAGKPPTIGFLGAGSRESWGSWTNAFVDRLHELGWIDNKTVTVEYRWAEGRSDRYAEIAAEFVRLKVDVIVTVGSAVPAAKQATSTIPIIFAIAVDPIGTVMVSSLARPGGNVTGLSNQTTETSGKRVQLLQELLPDLRGLAVIANVGYSGSIKEIAEVQVAAKTSGLDVNMLEIRRAEDIAPAFAKLNGTAQALYVCGDALMPIMPASIPWHSARDCPRCTHSVTFLRREVSSPTEQTTQTCFGARVTLSTRFSRR